MRLKRTSRLLAEVSFTCYGSTAAEIEVRVVELGREFFPGSRAARTAHTCVACRQEIPAGAPCRTETALADGEFWSGYFHNEAPYGCGTREDT